MALKLKVKKLNSKAQIPQFQTDGAAGFDVKVIDVDDSTVSPGQSKVFGTGLAFEVPEGYVMLVFSRSGMGFKHDLRLSNCVGVIDSDYRGELKVKLAYDGMESYTVAEGERVVQCVILETPKVEILEVEELSDTDRGSLGFGSTGKN